LVSLVHTKALKVSFESVVAIEASLISMVHTLDKEEESRLKRDKKEQEGRKRIQSKNKQEARKAESSKRKSKIGHYESKPERLGEGDYSRKIQKSCFFLHFLL
jgi:hypothetical protein